MTNNIGVNLRRFRKLKNYTQQELAVKAGISRVAYRNIETGDSEPRPFNLNALALALGISVFDLTEQVPKLESLRFRSHKSLTAREKAEREQISLEVATWLQDFNELEEMLDKRVPYQLRSIGKGESSPEQVAEEAREKLEIPCKKCIPDICELLEKAGVKIFLLKSKLNKFFGLSVGESDDGPAIAVNTDDAIPVERRIFTAAHELGHIILHGDSYVSDQIKENDEQEDEANRFAGYFLMPRESFKIIWEENRGLHWVDSVLHTKRRFRVSYKTVLKRLIDMGRTDNEIYKKFNNSYRLRYHKKLKYKEEPDLPEKKSEEPSRLDNADFMEDRLNRLVREAVEIDLISISRAAEILNISIMEMRNLIREWEMFV